jgi:hypothetical protein
MAKKSNVIIYRELNLVIKTPLKWVDIVFNREIFWLKQFSDSAYFPHFISSDTNKKEIRMTYCGEPITNKNCPADWEKQANNILNELQRYRCSHNDIKTIEVLVHNGILKLVDFGWATYIGEPIPKDWPINLGIEHRLDVHKFDDRFALFESLRQ